MLNLGLKNGRIAKLLHFKPKHVQRTSADGEWRRFAEKDRDGRCRDGFAALVLVDGANLAGGANFGL
jgi:hypothetical protein